MDLAAFPRTLVTEASDAIVLADSEGIIRFWNAGAARIFGYSAEEALGRSLDLMIPENLRARHWDGYRETMRTGETRYGAGDILAVPALRRDGSRISVEFSILPLREEGALAGIAAIMRDVTTRFEELRALRKEVAALKAAANRPAS